MILALEIRNLTVQTDKLVPLDLENFEVEKFKRALLDATCYYDGKACDVKIIVDIRARYMNLSCKCPGITAGQVGLSILVEYSLFSSNEAVLNSINENPNDMIEVGRFPIGSDPDHFLGFLHSCMQRGKFELRYH